MTYTIQEISKKYRISSAVITRLIQAGHILSRKPASTREGYRVEDTADFRQQIQNIKRFIKLKGNADLYDPAVDYNPLAENGVYGRKHIAHLSGFNIRTIALLEHSLLLLPDVEIAQGRRLYRRGPALDELVDMLKSIRAAGGSPSAVLLAKKLMTSSIIG